MTNDIAQQIQNCDACQRYQPSQQAEKLQPYTLTQTFPTELFAADIFEFAGKSYIAMVDAYSSFLIVEHLTKTSTDDVLKIFTHWFEIIGWPVSVITDNGPQFRDSFSIFLKEKGVKHLISSPYFSSNNGLAESAVKNAKMLLKKCAHTKANFKSALHEFRCTPRSNGLSPNVLFFGRNTRGALPSITTENVPTEQGIIKLRNSHKLSKISHFNDSAKSLPPLQVGKTVLVQEAKNKAWEQKAIVLAKLPNGRSYLLECIETGKHFRRNRKFLRPSRQSQSASKQTPVNNINPVVPRRSKRLQPS